MKFIGIYLWFCFLFKLNAVNSNSNVGKNLSRKQRTPLYAPYQSGIGLAAALAVPLDNGRADVFLSFCIGTGPGDPQLTNPDFPGLDPPLLTTIYEGAGGPANNYRKMKRSSYPKQKLKRSARNSFLTRKKFYRLFADNLKQNGFDPHYCLLRTICETAQYNFGHNNGVLGDIVHILFTPTTSQNEKLSTAYYKAEQNGYQQLCETKYGSRCPISVFDLITIIK